MTWRKREIMEIAKEAGGTTNGKIWAIYPAELEAFAKLVREDEREACAKACDELHYAACAEVIRARGQA
jgi:hypothetical protein